MGSRLRCSSAFTLLEVILSLTLLALLSGMVFGIVRVSLRTAMETRQVQIENDQLNQFIKLCRHTFQNLPATATLTLEITQRGTPSQQELTISGVPEFFAFGGNPISYEDSILGLRPDLEATQNSTTGQIQYYIGTSREDLITTDGNLGNSAAIRASTSGIAAPDDQGRYWMPLLPGVLSLNWKFFNEAENIWEEEWDSATLPVLIEMNLLMVDRTYPIRMVYALPTTKLSEANARLATTSTSSGGNQTTTVNNGSNNNLGGGPASGPGRGEGRGGGDRRGRGGRGQGPGPGSAPGQGPGPGQGQGGQPSPNFQNRSNFTQPSGGNAGSNQGAPSNGR